MLVAVREAGLAYDELPGEVQRAIEASDEDPRDASWMIKPLAGRSLATRQHVEEVLLRAITRLAVPAEGKPLRLVEGTPSAPRAG